MAVIMIDELPGAGPELMEGMRTAGVLDKMQGARGFRGHHSGATRSGYVVVEIWDSPEDWQAWFDGTIKPNLPPGVEVPAPTFADLNVEIAPQ